jgi:hypothetical protein
MPRIELSELERQKLARAGRDSITCQHGWRPIKTAPKDKDILLYCLENKSIHIGVGWTDYDCEYECSYFWVSEIGWVDPTHWMPLPKPPPKESR